MKHGNHRETMEYNVVLLAQFSCDSQYLPLQLHLHFSSLMTSLYMYIQQCLVSYTLYE